VQRLRPFFGFPAAVPAVHYLGHPLALTILATALAVLWSVYAALALTEWSLLRGLRIRNLIGAYRGNSGDRRSGVDRRVGVERRLAQVPLAGPDRRSGFDPRRGERRLRGAPA
jgi:hypothetical protein